MSRASPAVTLRQDEFSSFKGLGPHSSFVIVSVEILWQVIELYT
jgi:hypothetical protein